MYPAMMAELVFRGLKKQTMVQGSDSVAIKQFYNSHQEDVKREVEYIQKKLDPNIRFQSLNRLAKKTELLQ